MSEVSKRLRDRRLSVWEQTKALTDIAVEESRAFTAEEQGTWDALNEELDNLDKRIKSVLDGELRAKDADAQFDKLEGKPVTGKRGDPNGNGEKTVVDEFRSFLIGGPGKPREFELKPESRSVPTSYRDLSKLTDAAGKFTVPTSFYNQLVEHMIEVSGILQAGPTILNTASGEVLQIPKTLTHTTNPAIVLEAGALLEADPTFGQTSLGAFKYGRLIQVTRELLTDTGVDLEGYLSRSIGRALGNAFGEDMIVGAGTTEPRGVALDAGAGVTGPVGTTTTFGSQGTVGMGFDLLISLYHSVISPYRSSASCAFIMNDTTASLVRRIKTTEGLYVWQPAVTVGAPDTILGKPVFIDPFVASPAASAESIFFGDWSAYFVRYAGGIRFERSDDFAFGNDLVSFRAILRADAALVDLTGAVKSLTHSAI
jgi:HK97 family phage major capsid protein